MRVREDRQLATMTGAALLVQALRKKGIELIFTLNGAHIGEIYKACVDHGVRLVDTRHEEGATHMAFAWARLTRRPGVVAVTGGPGVTNTVTGIATAYHSATPMVVIGGKSPIPQKGMGALQEMDQVAMMQPITKWADTILDARRIPEYVNRAFRVAMGGQPGPVFLDVPTDVLRHPVEASLIEEVSPTWAPPAPAPRPELVEAAAALLREAQRPLLIAGGGIHWSGASGALVAAAERWGIPVLTTALNKGVFPGDHPLHVVAARSLAMGKADVVLLVGVRLNFILAYGQPPRFSRTARFIHVDVAAEEIGRNRRADLGIVGDARLFLESLAAMDPGGAAGRFAPWVGMLQAESRRKIAQLEADLRSDQVPIHPLRLCHEVRQLLADDAILVLDGGDILSYGRVVFTRNHPGQYVDPGPFGTMGIGVPAAMAAKLAFPDRPVIAVVGDGALGLNFMEFDTAIRFGLNIVVVVSNNGAWNIERKALEMDFGKEYVVATELLRTRYDLMAMAMGGHGEFVSRPEEIRPALQRALAAGRPALVNVLTDQDVISPDLARGLARVPDEQALEYRPVE